LRLGACVRTFLGFAIIAGTAALSGCSQAGGDQSADAACSRSPCGTFDIANTKESSPIFLAGAAVASPYRICVKEGSVILQTVGADGSAQSIGAEIRSGSCADVSFANALYIVGNTGAGRATGFYYRVP